MAPASMPIKTYAAAHASSRRPCVLDWHLACTYLSLYLWLHLALTATLFRTSPMSGDVSRTISLVISRLVPGGRTRVDWTSASHARFGIRVLARTLLDSGPRRPTRATSLPALCLHPSRRGRLTYLLSREDDVGAGHSSRRTFRDRDREREAPGSGRMLALRQVDAYSTPPANDAIESERDLPVTCEHCRYL
ncbi:hypothetical protein C8T65DRAFT_747040 [Cerioporus squamosus]|nr:hypothetical protein C8T65DRAFT_747040 [Cerioporus squamosus]